MNQKYIIIGSSAAGITACSSLRRLDATCEIICITKDNFWPKNTCLLIDYLLKDINIDLVPNNFFESNNITYIPNCEVIKINRKEKSILLDNGYILNYTDLILALGTSAKNLSISNSNSNIFLFHTFEDAQKLKKYIILHNPKSATVIGSGLNGLELASTLYKLNIKTTLINKNNILFKNILSVLNIYDANKINNWIINNIPIDISHNTNLKSDIIIYTIGSTPNYKLAAQADLETDNGIIVNSLFQTNDTNIWAIGDCAKIKIDTKLIKYNSWPAAVMHAFICTNYIVNKKVFNLRPEVISSKFFNLELLITGKISSNYNLDISEQHIIINCPNGSFKLAKNS